MLKRMWLMAAIAVAIGAIAWTAPLQSAEACGGFFCRNAPIDQNAERIIFTQNNNGTISAYIQIQYTGSAPDFSWILPLPSVITAEDIEVPEDASRAFWELEVATDPVFIAPNLPRCITDRRSPRDNSSPAAAPSAAAAPVSVFASGAVGPYGFDVIGSEDPEALVEWLRENSYRVTAEMEPLIEVYTEERFVFLAMRLNPESRTQTVQPVKVTYEAHRPMIPLRLTAVAANPNMAVMTWFYADQQAVPVNYSKMEVDDLELTFSSSTFRSNYLQLMSSRADEFNGQAFITEYAGPTEALVVQHPLLQELGSQYSYLTRLNTVISPEEMTLDPIFDYDPLLADVSNIHDLSLAKGLYDCEDGAKGFTGPFKPRMFGISISDTNIPTETSSSLSSPDDILDDTGLIFTIGNVTVDIKTVTFAWSVVLFAIVGVGIFVVVVRLKRKLLG